MTSFYLSSCCVSQMGNIMKCQLHYLPSLLLLHTRLQIRQVSFVIESLNQFALTSITVTRSIIKTWIGQNASGLLRLLLGFVFGLFSISENILPWDFCAKLGNSYILVAYCHWLNEMNKCPFVLNQRASDFFIGKFFRHNISSLFHKYMKVFSRFCDKTANKSIHSHFFSIPGAIAGPRAACLFLVCGVFSAVWHRKRLSNFLAGFGAKVLNRESLKTPRRPVRITKKKEEDVSIIEISHISLEKEEGEVKPEVKRNVEPSAPGENKESTEPGESHSMCFLFCTLNDHFAVGPVQCFCQLGMTSAQTTKGDLHFPVEVKPVNQSWALKQRAKTIH